MGGHVQRHRESSKDGNFGRPVSGQDIPGKLPGETHEGQHRPEASEHLLQLWLSRWAAPLQVGSLLSPGFCVRVLSLLHALPWLGLLSPDPSKGLTQVLLQLSGPSFQEGAPTRTSLLPVP